jgi:hypothetical protein
MLEQDYLMRMILAFFEAINRSLEEDKEHHPEEASDFVENGISQALDMDASLVLGLAPESFANIVKVSGNDPRVVEYVVHSLMLDAEYKEEAGEVGVAELRRQQADALADSFGFPRAPRTQMSADEWAHELHGMLAVDGFVEDDDDEADEDGEAVAGEGAGAENA